MIVLTLLALVCVFVFLYEVTRSFRLRDGVYGKNQVLGNTGNFVFLSMVSQLIVPLYLGYFIVVHADNILFYSTTAHIGLFILSCALVDFVYYLFHRALHRYSFLWRFHRVHHSDRHFNVSTSFRISLVEHLLILFFFAIPFFILPVPAIVYEAIFFLGIYQFITHSQYIIFPRWMSYIFVTPQTHRTHHNQDLVYQNSNFGGILCVWDKIFQTTKGEVASKTFGVNGYSEDNPVKYQIDTFDGRVR